MYNYSSGDNMNIDLTRLKSGIDKQIEINEIYSFSKDSLEKTDIISLDNVDINGSIYKNALDDLCINLNFEGVMVLPCAVTLEPVDYKFKVEIDDTLENVMEEIDENYKKIENSIDILPIIWENILMEMPMRVVSEKAYDAKLSGDGWKFITEDSHEEINPEFEKLKDLLKEKEV